MRRAGAQAVKGAGAIVSAHFVDQTNKIDEPVLYDYITFLNETKPSAPGKSPKSEKRSVDGTLASQEIKQTDEQRC
jgi:hypothetical protein